MEHTHCPTDMQNCKTCCRRQSNPAPRPLRPRLLSLYCGSRTFKRQSVMQRKEIFLVYYMHIH